MCTTCGHDGCGCPNLQRPGRDGLAGTIPDITIIANALPAGSIAAGEEYPVAKSGSLLNPVFAIGIPLPLQGPPGTVPVIPAPENGDDGIPCFTTLTASFVQPAVGDTVVVTVGKSSAFAQLSWAYIIGGGVYSVDANPLSPTQVSLRNPGASFGFPSGVPGNASPGATVAPNGQPAQVVVAGRPAPAGIQGPAGPAPQIPTLYAIPGTPPAAPENAFFFLANAAPPARATSYQPVWYDYGLAAWQVGPNIAGLNGTRIFFGNFDPSLTSPSADAVVGDFYHRYAGATFTVYQMTSVATWTALGSIPWPGSVTQTIVLTTPGVYAIPLEYFSYHIQTDKDIELNWSDVNYGDQGVWTVVINNVDGASNIDVSFTGGRWQKGTDTAILASLPVVLAAGERLMLCIRKNTSNGLYVVESAFKPAAL